MVGLEVKTAWNIPLLIHKADEKLLSQANSSAQHWTGEAGDPVPQPDGYLTEDQPLMIHDQQLTILHTPGHTPGGICLYNDEIIFTGDTIFAQGVGRTDFIYSNSRQLWQSIEKIKALGSHEAYAGHGKIFNI